MCRTTEGLTMNIRYSLILEITHLLNSVSPSILLCGNRHVVVILDGSETFLITESYVKCKGNGQ